MICGRFAVATMLLLVASHVPEPVQVPLPIAAALITLVVAVIGTWALAIYFSERSALQLGLGSRTQHAVIVTAHPDDECMFFAPTIATLRRHGVEVHLLCLSTGMRARLFGGGSCGGCLTWCDDVSAGAGDYEGLGERRQQELVDSAAVLGIQPETVTCVDVPELQVLPTRGVVVPVRVGNRVGGCCHRMRHNSGMLSWLRPPLWLRCQRACWRRRWCVGCAHFHFCRPLCVTWLCGLLAVSSFSRSTRTAFRGT